MSDKKIEQALGNLIREKVSQALDKSGKMLPRVEKKKTSLNEAGTEKFTTTENLNEALVVTSDSFICPEDGIAESISAYLNATTEHLVTIALFDYVDPANPRLIAVTQEITVLPGIDYVEFPFTDPKPRLTAGARYMPVIWANNPAGDISYYWDSVVGAVHHWLSLAYGQIWPDPFPTGNVNDHHLSIYLTSSDVAHLVQTYIDEAFVMA